MTKGAAFFHFWSSFGLPAYDENSVPTGKDAPSFPYITFGHANDGLDSEVPLSAAVWFRSTSPVELNAKVEEIAKAFENKFRAIVPCDGGGLLFRKGSPFSLELGDPSDNLIKKAVINYSVRFMTVH